MIQITPPREVDYEEITSLKCDVELQNILMSYPTFFEKENAKKWILERSSEGKLFSIVYMDQCIGYVVYNIHHAGKFFYFGYCISKSKRGNGFGHSALSALIYFAKLKFNSRKALLEVRIDNKKAISIYEKFGFRTVGTLNKHYIENDGNIDVVIMEYIL